MKYEEVCKIISILLQVKQNDLAISMFCYFEKVFGKGLYENDLTDFQIQMAKDCGFFIATNVEIIS